MITFSENSDKHSSFVNAFNNESWIIAGHGNNTTPHVRYEYLYILSLAI